MSLRFAWGNFSPPTHYHIQWSDKVDWERFDTVQEAQEAAKKLASPGETFTIKAKGKDCSNCASVRAKANGLTMRSSA